MFTAGQFNMINELWQRHCRNDLIRILCGGDHTPESDIDIVTIVRGDRLELQKKLKIVWDMSAEIGLENEFL